MELNYQFAVQWISLHVLPKQRTVKVMVRQPTVQLIAELAKKDPEDVALDVIRQRRKWLANPEESVLSRSYQKDAK